MGLLFLTPHEARLVVDGSDYDPTWRPFPGSELDRAWDDEDAEGALEQAHAMLDRRRPPYLDVNASSKYWHHSTRTRALLVADDAGLGQRIVGVGNCSTKRRRGRLGTSSVRLSAWRVFTEPIAVTDLFEAVSEGTRSVVRRLFAERDSREFPQGSGAGIWSAVRRLVPAIDELLDSLPEFPHPTVIPADALPVIDAELSALRFFTGRWRDLEPVPDAPTPTELASRLESMVTRDEDEVITDDTGGFLDWESDGRARGGWYLFRSPDLTRELRVKNINFKSAESATGADLVYVRSNPESVVLVQYKLLTSNEDRSDMFFRDKGGRLARQVEKMMTFSLKESDPGVAEPDIFRLSPDIGFVKFVVPSEAARIGEVIPIPAGRYHPAEVVRRMLSAPATGPRGGDIHRVERWRSLDGEMFARLVRDQWVGSVGGVTETLLGILRLDRRSLVLAVEENADRLPG